MEVPILSILTKKKARLSPGLPPSLSEFRDREETIEDGVWFSLLGTFDNSVYEILDVHGTDCLILQFGGKPYVKSVDEFGWFLEDHHHIFLSRKLREKDLGGNGWPLNCHSLGPRLRGTLLDKDFPTL